MTEVYLSGCSHQNIYHPNRNCATLKRANEVIVREKSTLDDSYTVCQHTSCAGSSYELAPEPDPPETDHDAPLIPGCPGCDQSLVWRPSMELWYCRYCHDRHESCSWRLHKRQNRRPSHPEPEPPEDAPDNVTAACPHCDACTLRWRTKGGFWYCSSCTETSDAANWRERYCSSPGVAPEGTLSAKDLEEMDPEDIGLPPVEVEE